jgi:hypothetical protein
MNDKLRNASQEAHNRLQSATEKDMNLTCGRRFVRSAVG